MFEGFKIGDKVKRIDTGVESEITGFTSNQLNCLPRHRQMMVLIQRIGGKEINF